MTCSTNFGEDCDRVAVADYPWTIKCDPYLHIFSGFMHEHLIDLNLKIDNIFYPWWKKQESKRWHRCANIAPQPMCRRLDYAPAIKKVCRKWFSMYMGESDAQENLNGWMFEMSWWDDWHLDQFPTDVFEQTKMVMHCIMMHESCCWELRWQWEATVLCCARLNMPAQATCVVKQAWILHKWCLVAEGKHYLKSNEVIEPGEKCEWGKSGLRFVMRVSRSRGRTFEEVWSWHDALVGVRLDSLHKEHILKPWGW